MASRERLGWYLPFVPENLEIVEFYETPSPAMDHEYMWKIKITDSEQYQKFEEQLKKGPVNVDGKNDYAGVSEFDEHPDWWKIVNFSDGILHMHRVQVIGSGGTEWGNIFALFDDEEGFCYIQAF